MDRRARIIATIGPASQDEETITALITAGVDVARLNFSHGDHESHAAVWRRLRAAAAKLNRPLAILQDLQGPKIRVGEIDGGQILLQTGQTFNLLAPDAAGSGDGVPVDFAGLPDSVDVGGRILLDDGNIELKAVKLRPDRVETTVVRGGPLKSNKGVNLPHARLALSAMTEKDLSDLAFGLSQGVDAVAVSFVHTAEDLLRVRAAFEKLAPGQPHPLLIAKLERPEALDNLEAIIEVSDGVMVARGDLGVEMSPETVPIAQKQIIATANRYGKLVITATQMLESMVNSPRPTRAEASDVANAIFDGSDAVMLSAETAVGLFPVATVTIMDAIIRQAEEHLADWGRWGGEPEPPTGENDVYYTTRAAEALARDRNVAALAAFTETGRTARSLAKLRPRTPILAFTPYPEIYPRLNLYWGVRPYLIARAESIEEMTRFVDTAMLELTPLQPGQQVVLVCGYPVSACRPANLALLHTIGTG